MKRLFRLLGVPGYSSVDRNQPKVKVGVCAMDKKAKSKPMLQILNRLVSYGDFEIITFGDEVILEQPIENWPLCDCLISWHSDGFPLKKAQAYVALRKSITINDLNMQDVLLDRRLVYQTLKVNGIPLPNHIIVEREGLEPGQDPEGFIEDEDYVELNGQRISKPFVEKPVSGEDHNVYIYYPASMGGGVKRLFRKVDNKSSQYDANHPGTIRRDGTFIIEEFLATGGTDVKVYTVGPRYAHAEARKSPVVDGKVLRTTDGKEMRFPVLLSPQEKEIACKVVNAFGQNICGFDLLRSSSAGGVGRSYVCDVNGWSFVKNSKRYYDDAAGILRSIILSAAAPSRLAANPNAELDGAFSLRLSSGVTRIEDNQLLEDEGEEEDEVDVPGLDYSEIAHTEVRGRTEELRCVLAVVRHGDRTPKQKLKIKVTAEPLLAMFQKYKDSKGKQAKLKTPSQLQELLDTTRAMLQAMDNKDESAEGADAMTADERDAQGELREKLRIVKTVLEQASFAGINRKVQLKPMKWSTPPSFRCRTSESAGDLPDEVCSSGPSATTPRVGMPTKSPPPLIHLGAAGFLGEEDMSLLASPSSFTRRAAPSESQDAKDGDRSSHGGSSKAVLEEAMLILKWGGVLTHAGRQQAEDLGKVFRMVMYPSDGKAGGGLLRLHSTYRHDLKIYSSDEGRVQASAAAFTKGLLDLEGNSLTPILVSLVNKDASMLEAFGKGASDDIKNAKNLVYSAMTWDPEKESSSFKPSNKTPPQTPPTHTPNAISRNESLSGLLAPAEEAKKKAGAAGATEPQAAPNSPARQAAKAAAVQGEAAAAQAAAAAAAAAGSAHVLVGNIVEVAAAEVAGNHLVSMLPGSTNSLQEAGSSVMLTSLGSTGSLQNAGSVTAPSMASGMLQTMGSSMAALPTGAGADGPLSPAAAAAAAASSIKVFPENPLLLLRRLHELLKGLSQRMRQLCLQADLAGGTGTKYSSLSQEPGEWNMDAARPCSGEQMLLMFDRWNKLVKTFYSEKKGQFDISKIPDIYDSAKYDSIHNRHLLDPDTSCLKEVYVVAKTLADAVIPNEYGVGPQNKLRIGSTICGELLGKLVMDMAMMREESRVIGTEGNSPRADAGGAAPPWEQSSSMADETARVLLQQPSLECDDGQMVDSPIIHRLAPELATEINTPLRHVRTRVYFTSESHIHSLVNVLRLAHLHPSHNHASAPGDEASEPQCCRRQGPLLSPEALEMLEKCSELDYLTHVVFRMYEDKAVPVDAADRFRIEILFSPGANYDMFDSPPLKQNHTLPAQPRMHMESTGITLLDLEEALKPMAKTAKFALCASTYILQGLAGFASNRGSQGGGTSGTSMGASSDSAKTSLPPRHSAASGAHIAKAPSRLGVKVPN